MIPGYFHFPFKEVRQVTADKDLMKKTVQGIIENKRFLMQQNFGESICELSRKCFFFCFDHVALFQK